MGVKRYVLDNPRPFLVTINHGKDEFRGGPLDRPLGTLTASRGDALVTPVLVGCGGPSHAGEPKPTDSPAGVVMPKDSRAVVAPVVTRLGQTNGNGTYTNDPTEPLTTITSKAEHLILTPVLDRQFGKSGPAPVDAPLPTTTAGGQGKSALLVPTLVQSGYGEREGQAPRVLDVHAPLGTAVGSSKRALVAAFVAKHFGGMVGVPADTPLPTTTARGTQNQLVAVNTVRMNHGEKQWNGADEPLPTVTTGNHAALVYSFLTKYFGTAVGVEVDVPLPTATGKARFGLVTVEIAGEPYVVTDIGMRMLRPRELATAQGFGPCYVLTGTATNQVERIGNSVPPPFAKAIAAANVPELAEGGITA